jgi:hypothetical protein
MRYGFDAAGWYIGVVDDDEPRSTEVPPPIASVTEVPGEPRARWQRYAWRIAAYAPPPAAPPALQSYGFDEDGFYTGATAIDAPNSTPIAPRMLSTDNTPGVPRARWIGYAWVVRANPPAPVVRPWITLLAFRRRFTSAERSMLERKSLDDPAGTEVQRNRSAAVRAWFADLAAAGHADLADDMVRAPVLQMESAAWIGAGRALEILDAPIAPDERAGPSP